jgi:hypothetical protein
MKRFIIMLLSAALTTAVFSQYFPGGYILQYQQNFSGKNPISDFRSDDFRFWTVKSVNGNKYLEYSRDIENDTNQAAFSSLNICLIKDYIFGDFIIEASLMQPEDTTGKGIWILFGIRDSLKYYCVDVSSTDEVRSKGLYVVEDARPLEIPCTFYKDIRWSKGKWHKVRIERNIVDASVRIFFDDMKNPCLETKDRTFIMGYIGFGSGTGKWRIDNIEIWSQTTIPQPAEFLKEKP